MNNELEQKLVEILSSYRPTVMEELKKLISKAEKVAREDGYKKGWKEAEKEFKTDKADQQYRDGIKQGLAKSISEIGEVDGIDFFEIKEDSVGEKEIEMNEDFEAGAVWGWNEARQKLIESQ